MSPSKSDFFNELYVTLKTVKIWILGKNFKIQNE